MCYTVGAEWIFIDEWMNEWILKHKEGSPWPWNWSPHSDIWCLYSNIKISFLHKSVMYPESVQLWCKLFLDVKCIKPFPSVVSLVGISWLHCSLLILCWWGWPWGKSRCFCDWAGVRKGLYSRTLLWGGTQTLLSPDLGSWPLATPPSQQPLLTRWDFLALSHRFLSAGQGTEEGKEMKWEEEKWQQESMRRRETQDSEERREKKEEMRLNMGRRSIVFAAKCL